MIERFLFCSSACGEILLPNESQNEMRPVNVQTPLDCIFVPSQSTYWTSNIIFSHFDMPKSTSPAGVCDNTTNNFIEVNS